MSQDINPIRDLWVVVRVVILILAIAATAGLSVRIYNHFSGATNDCKDIVRPS